MKRASVMIFACLMLCLGLSTSGCKGEKCHTPTPPEQLRAEVMDELDDSLEAMSASAPQRARVREEAAAIVTASLKLRGVREPQKEQLLNEVQKLAPDRKVIEALAAAMSKDAVVLYHSMIDVLVELWPDFTQAQRKKLADHLEEPFEPLAQSWLVDQLLEYQLGELEATTAQRELVRKLKKDYYFKINVLRRQAHRDRQVIFAELRKETPAPSKAHRLIDASARRYDRVVMQLIDDGEELLATTTPAQRTKLYAQLDRLRTCKP